jgi:hypothetical protein
MIDPKAFLAQHRDQLKSKNSRGFELSGDVKEIIDLIVTERRAGKRYTVAALWRVVRTEFDLDVSYERFRVAVMRYTGDQW